MTDHLAASPARCFPFPTRPGSIELRAGAGRATASSWSRPAAARKALADAGLPVLDVVRSHRLSRDDGRPGQDAASRRCMAACWRSATMTSTPRRCGRTAFEPIDLLVVNLYPFEATVAEGAANFDDLHREYRHRRPRDDPRRGQEPRATSPWWSNPSDYAGAAGRARAARRRDDARAAPASSPPRPMRRTAAYDAAISNWFAADARAIDAPAYRAFGGQLAEALRYGENPHQSGGVLSHAGAAPRRRHRAAAAGQAALLQQSSTTPTRPMSASPSSIPRAPRRAPSSSTPIPAASPKALDLLDAYRKALACDPVSAFGGIVALNQHARCRRRSAPSPRSSRKSSSRRTPATRRSPSSAPRKTCACCWPAACPIRAQRA